MTTEAALGEVLRQYALNRRAFIEDCFMIIPRESSQGPVPMRFTRVQEEYWEHRALKMVIAKARRVKISSIIEADFTSAAILTPNFHVLQMLQKPIEETLSHHMPRIEMFIHSAQKKLGGWPVLSVDNVQHKVFDWGESEHGARIVSSITLVGSGSKDVVQGGQYDYYHITEVPSYEADEIEAMKRGLLGSPFAAVRYESRPERSGDVFHTMYQDAKEGNSASVAFFVPWFSDEEHDWPISRPLWDNAPAAMGYDDFPLNASDALIKDTHRLSWSQMRYWKYALDLAGGDEEMRASQMATDDTTCWRLAGSPVVPMGILDSLMDQVRPPLPKDLYPEKDDLGGMLRLWLRPQLGEAYAIYADPAEGYVTSHDTAIVIRRARDWAYVGEVRGKISPEDTGRLMVKLGRHFGNALLGWEREPRSAGIRVIAIDQHRYPNIFTFREKKWGHPDNEPGLPVTRWTKDGIIQSVIDFMSSGEYQAPSAVLVEQYSMLQRETRYSARDDKVQNTYNTARLDLLMADAGCFQMRDQALRLNRRVLATKPPEYLLPPYLR